MTGPTKTVDGGAQPRPAALPKSLTVRQRRFVQEYLVDLNGAKAAIRAGYSARSAPQVAWRTLRKPLVAAAFERAIEERAGVTRARVLAEFAAIGFANLADYLQPSEEGGPRADFEKLTRTQAAALAEVTVEEVRGGRTKDAPKLRRTKFKLHDKLAALDRLGRATRLFDPRREEAAPEGARIEVVIAGKDVNLL